VEKVFDNKRLYTESKELLAKASINLREWGSNSKEFYEFVVESD